MNTVTKTSIIGLIATLSLSAFASIQKFSERSLQTEIEINASAEQVWNALVDFRNYPNWNPFILDISGELKTGKKLNAKIKLPDGNPMHFEPKLQVVKPQQELRWLGRVWLPRLFDGEHYFIIEQISLNKTRFIHGENFRGILVPLLWNNMERSTKNGFESMNKSLKKLLE